MFTENDIQQIKNKGITLEQVNAQVLRIKNGMSYSNLIAAATVGKGIEKFNDTETKELIRFYESKQDGLNIIKFVPASGAASRMFKFLFQFLNNFDITKESINNYIERTNDALIKTFITNLKTFPFYQQVLQKLKETHSNFGGLSEDEMYVEFIKTMLNEDALNYSFFPKGLLPFHKYQDGALTAFQEHLFESTLYASSNGEANLHFTVSEKHHKYFNTELNEVKGSLEKKTKTVFNVDFSYQKEATEVLALTTDNIIFRTNNNSILFRPAGHGALLENLNDLNNDIVFIKNIDNIVVANMNIEISEYKKLLAGVLLKVQKQAFEFLNLLDGASVSENDLKEMANFASSKMNLVLGDNFDSLTTSEKIAYFKDKLNRPIRVCGMVKNEGEPGGGPFWVKDQHGNISLQIVEFAQINVDDNSQSDIVKNATHFNPTDLVCGVKNYKGEKFNLMEFVDPEAAFITMKTQNGIDIQALELPGLWNGSMAYWNSIFVEVPLETFNPVKTVNDLLKPAHQAS
ncbi:ribosylnicotinamide kinase homolog [Jejuia pallidilutea]|uniref:Ribosylnicotinamide kinase homolog n=2 Tax=Jejuia pallidilutea TaxID=504487 RepID=A0A090VSR5_9FLAO|nr:ribosylnicotinamide kinase homolog [Jejuia pallidilutea]GAL69584.1 ribosylnicotinamide kinase homolog [Jejuia pallidilutea]GAL87950.1 ribosylnicotinamide kinase homolog [Jejuia pallidilutea]